MLETLLYEIVEFLKISLGYWFFVEMFQMRRKTQFHKAVFLLLLGSLAGVQAWDAEHYYISHLAILINPIFDAVILTVFCECKYRNALLWQWMYGITMALLKLPLLILRCIWLEETSIYINLGLRNIWEISWYLVLIIIFYFVFLRKLKEQIAQMIRGILEKRSLVVLGVCVLEWFLLIGLYEGVRRFTFSDLMISIIVSIINMAVLMRYIYTTYLNKKIEEENLKLQGEMLIREQSVIKKYYIQNTRQMHDIKHILLGVYKCISENDLEKAKIYLKEYTEILEEGQRRIWTGFSEIDLSVNYYYQIMKEKEIPFSIEADVQEVPMEEMDMMIVLGNLLDNAIEAAEKCQPEERKVNLQLRNVNEMFLIVVENSSSQIPEIQKDSFLSSKDEKVYHGWGIKNIKQIVEKYGGDIQFTYTEEYFRAEILI